MTETREICCLLGFWKRFLTNITLSHFNDFSITFLCLCLEVLNSKLTTYIYFRLRSTTLSWKLKIMPGWCFLYSFHLLSWKCIGIIKRNYGFWAKLTSISNIFYIQERHKFYSLLENSCRIAPNGAQPALCDRATTWPGCCHTSAIAASSQM